MINSESDKFKSMLTVLYSMYGKREPDNILLRAWWMKLAKFDFNVISQAFDTWSDTKTVIPTPADILPLCRPKEPVYAQISKTIDYAGNQKHAEEVKQAIEKMTKPNRDYKDWARKIIANPKNYPDISLRYAKEALNAN
jgi:hypothetical protein